MQGLWNLPETVLPAVVAAKKLYLELRDASTDLILHKSPDLAVDPIGRRKPREK